MMPFTAQPVATMMTPAASFPAVPQIEVKFTSMNLCQPERRPLFTARKKEA
jgi:hypothetical protein